MQHRTPPAEGGRDDRDENNPDQRTGPAAGTPPAEADAPAAPARPTTPVHPADRGPTTPADRAAQTMPSVSLGRHFEMHPIVFPAGASIVIGLVLTALLLPADGVREAFTGLRGWIGLRFGWLYVATMTGLLVFAAWLAFSRVGRVRLGGDEERPEFGRLSWFAMLFSAGMGIGLVFWSVAEPIYHYTDAPPGVAQGLDPARVSLAVTIFHWGLHPWALYAAVGLGLAYFGFRRGMPLGFRSLLHPLLGDRVWGRTGDAVDPLAIIATLTGVATSLGIGAQQVNAGLGFLFGMPQGQAVQVLIIAAITAVATVSVVLGLAAGIRRLSEINLALAGSLMVLVILGGGLIAFLGSTVENIGSYLQLLPFSSFRTGAVSADGRQWLSSWTVFYWAWWISWSPFVGMFIARISRGRTVREFVLGVVLVPTLVGIAWLTAFGSTTLREHEAHAASPEAHAALPTYTVARTDGDGEPITLDGGGYDTREQSLTAVEYLAAPVTTDDGAERIDTLPTVLFALLGELFGSGVWAIIGTAIATLCVVLFFVTSSDSASLVIDIIASGGNPDPPVGTRLFWAITEGVVAAALLLIGGLEALQAASITAALPFTIILLAGCVGLTRALRNDPAAARLPPAGLR